MLDTAETRLRQHREAVHAAMTDLIEARSNRDAEIRRCVAARFTISSIARAAGISRNAVYDIAGPPPAAAPAEATP